MLTTVIPVTLTSLSAPNRSYDIVIEPDSLSQIGEPMAVRGIKGKVLVVSHPLIFKHYGPSILNSLTQAGFQVSTCLIPAGEHHKTLRSISRIYDAALRAGLERSSTILALGGGVIGDMAGFAAATWLRGIGFVQVPTSLLAMVDASIGGKTGVNHPQGKNLIGAFHQPRLVWIDPSVLKTLPAREFRSALAEVIKYGVIQDPDLFDYLESRPKLHRYADWSPEALFHILVRSAESKAWVVQQDERESGLRAILNYGHTIGHALESVTQYRQYLHGEAVALGMVAAGDIAVELGWWIPADSERQKRLLQRSQLPITLPSGLDFETMIQSLQSDKKVKDGQVQFILPRRVGQVEITSDVGPQIIQTVLQKMAD